MPKQIIIAEQHHIAAVFWEDRVQELVVATGNQQVSDIYLGVVENVIPGIDAAFVNIGDAERNGFIHVTDLGPLRLRRTAAGITELLAPQQKVLVQVMKEPTGNKGPRLTGNITLPGRYLVLMPYGKGVNLSRRIRDENERSRLRALAVLMKPAGMGILIRTEAEGKDEEAIIEDLEFLQKQWESVQLQATSTRAPALLNRDDDFIQRVLRDMYSDDVNRIVVDSSLGVKRVKQQLANWSGGRSPEGVLIDHHREKQPILDYFRINAAVREALKPRVELPSGGYIIIEPTEALTVIDVNSGSFTRSATSRETVLWTNSEAATEIARQLKLRNIGGVIIVDFIDMDTRRDQLKLLEHFTKALKSDKARPQIAQLSELGLVELTRKRQGKNVYELFGQPCATCGGLGHLVHLPGRGEAEALELLSVSQPTLASRPTDFGAAEFDDRGYGYELEEEDSDRSFDLLHHPSYQEQAGGRDNGDRKDSRRRFRRGRFGEKGGKEEGYEVVKTPSRNDLRNDNRNDSRNDLRVTPKPTPRDVEVDREVMPALEDRKVKPQSRSQRREDTPQQVIAVEMTEREKDVYALMGVSPLVKIGRDPKELRGAVVKIVALGEAPSEVTMDAFEQMSVETAVDVLIENSVDIPMEIVEPKPIEEMATLTTGTEVSGVRRRRRSTVNNREEKSGNFGNSLEIIEDAPVISQQSTSLEIVEENGNDDTVAPVARRRRRRSSAADT
jgi:ribonuclease E